MENNTSPAPVHQLVGRCGICCPSRIGMPHDSEGCILAEGHDSPHEYIADGSRVTWETDLDCDCDDCLKSDSFADNCLVYDIAPNAQGQPATTEPAEQAGRGPLGCADVLGADGQSEGKP